MLLKYCEAVWKNGWANAELKKIKLVATVEYYFADEKLNHTTFEKIIQGNIFITD